MPNQPSGCETGMNTVQAALEEALKSFEIHSEEVKTEISTQNTKLSFTSCPSVGIFRADATPFEFFWISVSKLEHLKAAMKDLAWTAW